MSLILHKWDQHSSRLFYDALLEDPELQALAQLEAMKYSSARPTSSTSGTYAPWRFDVMYDPPEGYVPPPDASKAAQHSASAVSAVVSAAAAGADKLSSIRALDAPTYSSGAYKSDLASARRRGGRRAWLASLSSTETHAAALYCRAVMLFNEHRVSAADVLNSGDATHDPTLLLSARSASAGQADPVEVDMSTASKAWLEAAAVLPTPEAAEAAVLVTRPDVGTALEELHNPRIGLCQRMWHHRAVVGRMITLRIWLRHTFLASFTRYDPQVSRLSRLLLLAVSILSNLFITALWWWFAQGASYDRFSPLSLDATLFVAVVSALMHLPLQKISAGLIVWAGVAEFALRYPSIARELARRTVLEQHLSSMSTEALRRELQATAAALARRASGRDSDGVARDGARTGRLDLEVRRCGCARLSCCW